MRRRDFIGAFALVGGGLIARPLAGHAQQAATPVVGFLSSLSREETTHLLAAFHRGLYETGIVPDKDVALDYRWSDGDYARLPGYAADLVRRRAAVILAAAPPAALAAKAATATIPIVFVVGLDPVAAGLVSSLSRPGGNATGVTLITAPLGQKRLELVLGLVSTPAPIGMLVNPNNADTAFDVKDAQVAALAQGQRLVVANATTQSAVESAIASLAEQRVAALLIGSDPFFVTYRDELVAMAARAKIPTIYPFREFVASGGLMSYGPSLADAYRQAGGYVARVLKGERPADLPVAQPTTFELVINLKAAKALGLAIPPALLARADEVIE